MFFAQPIFYPDENGQKLNVEEKKQRPPRLPMDGSGGRPNMGELNMRSAGGPQQQQQRGPGNFVVSLILKFEKKKKMTKAQKVKLFEGGPGAMRGTGNRGGRGSFGRSSDGGRSGGGMRQSGGNPNNPPYASRR